MVNSREIRMTSPVEYTPWGWSVVTWWTVGVPHALICTWLALRVRQCAVVVPIDRDVTGNDRFTGKLG